MLQGLSGGLINPQVSGLVQQMFRGADRGRAFGVLGTTVGLGTAIGPLVGGALIALGGPTLGWRLVFFVNIPVGLVVIAPVAAAAARRRPRPRRHRLDVLGAALLGGATFCVLFACVEYDAAAATPGSRGSASRPLVLLGLFLRRERRLTVESRDPLVDLRLFRRPSYVSGITLALAFFPAMAGLPLVLALFYQRGLGYTALESALGVTAYAVGSAVSAPLVGPGGHPDRAPARGGRRGHLRRRRDRAGRGGAGTCPDGHATLALAPPLFVMGCGQGMLITPNQTLALMDVDPLMGSAAGGVLQTGQRIGLAIGQALIGAVFFNSLTGTGPRRTPTPGARGRSRRSASSRSPWPSASTTSCGPDDGRPRSRSSVSAVSDADPHASGDAGGRADRRADRRVRGIGAVVVLGSGWGPAADAFGDAGRRRSR